MKSPISILAVVLVCTAAASPAAGQTAAPDTSRARDLASRGRAAFDRGDLATGCPLLEEAVRLDGELLGAGFALGECREKEGKLATAHRIFLDIAARSEARGEPRAVEAKARAAALAPRLPRLRVDVAEAAKAMPGLAITVDGQPWPAAAWGSAEPLDGGSHELVATADRQSPWSMRFEAVEGATVDATVPFGRSATQGTSSATADPTPDGDEATADGSFPWATAGLVTAGVGVGVLGLGGVLGLVAKGSYDGAEGCDADNACTPAGAAERNDARGLADVGTVFFIAGGLLAAGGVTVFLVAPDDEAKAVATVRVAPGAITVDGRF